MAKRSESVVTYHKVADSRRAMLDAFETLDDSLWGQFGHLAIQLHRNLIALEGNLWGVVRF